MDLECVERLTCTKWHWVCLGFKRALVFTNGIIILVGLWGCSDLTPHADAPLERVDRSFQNMKKLWKKDIVLYNSAPNPTLLPALWYGALKALENFPLEQVDAQNGVLQTQWITPSIHVKERFQVRVILVPTVTLNTQALSVVVFHEILEKGKWQKAPPSEFLAFTLKHKILVQARAYGKNPTP